MREQIWACERNHLLQYFEILNSGHLDEKQVSLFGMQDEAEHKTSILSIEGDTASITIQGILTKADLSPIDRFFGIIGTSFRQILEAIAEVKTNQMIRNVRLLMNTPGGEAMGTDEVSQAVAALVKAGIPVVAENHGITLSGGYWIASQASEIVSISPANMTGSIGVVIAGFDQTERLNKMGVKRVVILSKNAPKKGGMINEAGRAGLQEQVDAIERVFMQRISEGRGIPVEQIAQNFGRGGLMIAQDPDHKKPDALTVGMIDKVISTVTPQSNGQAEFNAENDDDGCGGGT